MSVNINKTEEPEIGKTCVLESAISAALTCQNIIGVFTEISIDVKIVNFCMYHVCLQILYVNISLEQKGENFTRMQEYLCKMLPLLIGHN